MRRSILTEINRDCCEIDDSVYIGPFCCIGLPGEVRDTFGDHLEFPRGKVIIQKETILAKQVTVDAPVRTELTKIGANCFIMNKSHIGHDARLGNGVTVAPFVCVGGKCLIGDGANLGTGTVIHQRINVGAGAMVGMGTIVTKHIPPFMLVRMHAGRLVIVRPNYKYLDQEFKQKDVLEFRKSFKNVILGREEVHSTNKNPLLDELQLFVSFHQDGKLLQDFIDTF